LAHERQIVNDAYNDHAKNYGQEYAYGDDHACV